MHSRKELIESEYHYSIDINGQRVQIVRLLSRSEKLSAVVDSRNVRDRKNMETHRFLNNHQIKELPHLPQRSEEDHKRMIRKMGLKVTEQRITILNYLYKMPKHITAQELYECIHPVDSSIGFATIYRFLKRLVENKIISETRVNNMPARYELIQGGHHDHMVCLHCGRISEFYNSQIEKLQKDIAEKLGFILTDHLMELQGYCFECRSKCPPESKESL